MIDKLNNTDKQSVEKWNCKRLKQIFSVQEIIEIQSKNNTKQFSQRPYIIEKKSKVFNSETGGIE